MKTLFYTSIVLCHLLITSCYAIASDYGHAYSYTSDLPDLDYYGNKSLSYINKVRLVPFLLPENATPSEAFLDTSPTSIINGFEDKTSCPDFMKATYNKQPIANLLLNFTTSESEDADKAYIVTHESSIIPIEKLEENHQGYKITLPKKLIKQGCLGTHRYKTLEITSKLIQDNNERSHTYMNTCREQIICESISNKPQFISHLRNNPPMGFFDLPLYELASAKKIAVSTKVDCDLFLDQFDEGEVENFCKAAPKINQVLKN